MYQAWKDITESQPHYWYEELGRLNFDETPVSDGLVFEFFGMGEIAITYTRIPEGLRVVREWTELSQTDFAAHVKMRQPHLAAMESGKRPISRKTAIKVIDFVRFYMLQPSDEERAASKRLAAAAVNAVMKRGEIRWG